MRSRYTAYALDAAEYIVATTDPEGPQWEADREAWIAHIREFSRRFEFGGVVILDSETDGDDGHVHFRAILRERKGGDASFEENSSFVRCDGQWLYHGGT